MMTEVLLSMAKPAPTWGLLDVSSPALVCTDAGDHGSQYVPAATPLPPSVCVPFIHFLSPPPPRSPLLVPGTLCIASIGVGLYTLSFLCNTRIQAEFPSPQTSLELVNTGLAGKPELCVFLADCQDAQLGRSQRFLEL